ncbi:ankyrin [Glonium stellatum]|uniref:Ankyrin n=1 Tax=Glonium stellatum TaxID=574774 RepID=A0A8E2JNX6_9PEZI|nr:ankyrin [Glonium stellatum]
MASGEPESSEEPGSSKRLGDSEGQKARKEEEDSEKPVESTNVAKSRDSQDATRSNRKSYIEMRDNGGRSALYFAARNNCQSVVTTLLEAKATITTEDLNIAAEKGHEDVVRQFLEKLASDKMLISKFFGTDKKSALHWAAEKGKIPVVKILLKHDSGISTGASPQPPAGAKQGAGNTEPTDATPPKRLINKLTAEGLTALDLAAAEGQFEVVKVLLRNNAVVNIVGKDGLRTLDRAFISGNKDVAETISKRYQELKVI